MFGGIAGVDNARLSIGNYYSLLIGWNAQVQASLADADPNNHFTNIKFHGGDSKYCGGKEARIQLIDAGWGGN